MKQFDWLSWFAKYGTLLFLAVLFAGFSLARSDVFPTWLNFLNILNQSAILGVIAVGLTVCLVMGLFDLSVAPMATLGGYLVCRLLTDQTGEPNVLIMILLTLLLAGMIGVINGAIVSYLGVSAFIGTLAVGSVMTGITLGYSDSRTILGGIPETFLALGQDYTFGIPNAVLAMLLVAFVLWLLLEHTQMGRNLYAIGGNAEASRLSGIAVKRYALLALGVSAACAAVGGIMAAASLGAGRPQGVGDSYLLNAFAAVFIGASTMRPGQFHILGTLIGVLLIGVITNGLSILGAPTYWQYVVQGILLIIAMGGAGMIVLRHK